MKFFSAFLIVSSIFTHSALAKELEPATDTATVTAGFVEKVIPFKYKKITASLDARAILIRRPLAEFEDRDVNPLRFIFAITNDAGARNPVSFDPKINVYSVGAPTRITSTSKEGIVRFTTTLPVIVRGKPPEFKFERHQIVVKFSEEENAIYETTEIEFK